MTEQRPDQIQLADREEARLVYQHAADEIRFFKSRQWQVAYYVLLADAALCTAPRLAELHDVAVAMRILLSLVIIAGSVWSIVILRGLRGAIEKERGRMNMARQYLPLVTAARSANPPIGDDGVSGLQFAAISVAGLIALAINVFGIPAR